MHRSPLSALPLAVALALATVQAHAQTAPPSAPLELAPAPGVGVVELAPAGSSDYRRLAPPTRVLVAPGAYTLRVQATTGSRVATAPLVVPPGGALVVLPHRQRVTHNGLLIGGAITTGLGTMLTVVGAIGTAETAGSSGILSSTFHALASGVVAAGIVALLVGVPMLSVGAATRVRHVDRPLTVRPLVLRRHPPGYTATALPYATHQGAGLAAAFTF